MTKHFKSNLYKSVPNIKLHKQSGIYQIRNLINGKMYIGSSTDMSSRRREHVNELHRGLHKNKHLQNSYNKYGDENFVFEVVEYISTGSYRDLLDREGYYIVLFKTVNPKYGYNLKNAELINPGQSRMVICLESRKVYNSINEAGVDTGTLPSNISNCCNHRCHTANKLHWLFVDEYEKLVEDDIQRYLSRGNPYHTNKKKVIICVDTGEIYKSICDASKATGVATSCIKEVCEGKKNTAGAFHWMYYEDYKKASMEYIEYYKNIPTGCYGQVICLETKQIFKGVSDAARAVGYRRSTQISHAVKNPEKTVKGCHWMYYAEYLKKLHTP